MTTLSEAMTIAMEHHRAGRLDLAEDICRRILAVEPGHPDAIHLLGAIAHRLGKLDLAIAHYRQSLACRPHAHLYRNLGMACHAKGDLEGAVAALEHAVALAPRDAAAFGDLGTMRMERGDFAGAATAFATVAELDPNSAQAQRDLAAALAHQELLTDASACLERAVALAPDSSLAQADLGSVYVRQGRVEHAIAFLRRAIQLPPYFPTSHSNYLCALRTCPGVSAAALRDASAEFGVRCAAGIEPFEHVGRGDGARDRRLRLGFSSAAFGRSPVGAFLIRVLENLDHRDCEVLCYSDTAKADTVTARFRAAADAWHEVLGLSDEQLAERIRADRVDILFDLSGHACPNRLPVFARKPAPIQVTWIDSVGTTGLKAIDYVLADRCLVPLGEEANYVEQVLRLPDGYVCYDPYVCTGPADDSASVGPLPAGQRGYVTFGSFNRADKIHAAVVDVWGEILRRLPDSRLLLKHRAFADPGVCERYQKRFASLGVEPGRVEFQGFSPSADSMRQYNQIDIALDPFPHNGGLTTCDALWMGVPVVTCPGETFASRQSLSHLSNIGLTETIARNLEEYVEIALHLASDLSRLAEIRAGLRERMARSPLCDGKRFADTLLRLLREAWRRWCEQKRPASVAAWDRNAGNTDHPVATLSETLAIALAHHQAGRLDLAEEIYRRILAAEPEHAEALHLLGVVCYQVGKPEVAIEHIQRAIRLKGTEAAFHNNLGEAHRAAGTVSEAIACYRRAIELQPDYAEAHNNLGIALQFEGKLGEAIACYHRALELKPDYAQAHNNLGIALKHEEKLDEAVACYRRALELKPDYAEAHNNLGNAFKDQGKLDEAVVCYRRALERTPGNAEVHHNLGNAFQEQGKLDEAVACYRRAVHLRPDQAKFHTNLGVALQNLEKLAEAVACYRRALELEPDYAEAQSNLGSAFHHQGKHDEAIACYRRALELNPDLSHLRDKYLCELRYHPDVTPASLSEACAEYERRYAAPLRAERRAHENSKDPERPLLLGFVSPRFALGPVGAFLIRALEDLNSRPCQIACYSDGTRDDEFTPRFKAVAGAWSDVARLTDEQLAERVRKDRIDILFDLAGHSPQNRLLTFARKPAPIQVTWLDSVGTSGLSAIDYLLADRHLVPIGAESHYAEKILRMPDGYVCYEPSAKAPAVGPLPAIGRGHVTFGSFNQPAKVNRRVVELWARILRQLPDSRLVLKYRGWSDPESIRHWRQRFQAEGIGRDRVEFQGPSPLGEYLGEYHHIDVALDPFPHNGGLTTCDCLWMGVPVVTCPGETFAGRQSLSHLSTVGLTETIAGSLEAYVDVAVRLANDLPRLADVRAGLRQRVADSPLCDGKRFAENLMKILRQIWREWCAAVR